MSDSPLVSRYCAVTFHVEKRWKASLCDLVRNPDVHKAMTRVVALREVGHDEADPDVIQARAGLRKVIARL
jgi:hypothetical protein